MLIKTLVTQIGWERIFLCVGYKKPAGKRKTEGAVTGCQFQEGVTKNAWLMFLTSLSYFVIQVPAYMVDDQKTKSDYPSEKVVSQYGHPKKSGRRGDWRERVYLDHSGSTRGPHGREDSVKRNIHSLDPCLKQWPQYVFRCWRVL